jgi:2-polyprenyl-3-methyl-5-hydroxy-6-metoxy-1,4-benzoquinol methylase
VTPREQEYSPHQVQWTGERVARVWDYYGQRAGADVLYFSAHSGGSVVQYLQRRLPLDGLHVLDFGCGNGAMLQRLASRNVRCSGLDFSVASVEIATQRLRGLASFDGASLARGIPTDFGDHSFDVVMLIEVVEHLLPDQLEPTLAEVRRILRPGGHVLVTVPHAEDLQVSMCHCPECGATFHRWQHLRSLGVASLEGVMRSAGFETVVCEPTYFLPESANWKGRLASWLSGRWQRLCGRPPRLPHLAYLGRKPKVAP